MLVLTRKLKEQIVIGDDTMVITVLGLSRGRVRLGIEAPADMRIRRQDLVEETAHSNSQAELVHS